MPATAASGPAFPPPPGLAGQDTLADDLIAAVGDLKRSLRRRAGPPWPDLASLSGSQVELLRLIRRRPDLTVAAAAAELRLAANTVSTLVGQLTGVGLIRRTPDPEDRRIARLRLTPDADRALQLWGDRRTAAVAAALERWPAPTRRRLRAALPLLRQLADELDAGVGTGRGALEAVP